jgi:hypothetical protein
MLRISAVLLLLCSIICGCSRTPVCTGANFGSNIIKKGIISDKNLSFVFKYSDGSKNSDLYNFIYFQGDTVCFSFDYNFDVDTDVKVWFIDPKTGRIKIAERVEILKSRVYGFSLAGSLLEFYRMDTLHDTMKPERKIVQPFTVIVEAYRNGVSCRTEKSGAFTVSF